MVSGPDGAEAQTFLVDKIEFLSEEALDLYDALWGDADGKEATGGGGVQHPEGRATVGIDEGRPQPRSSDTYSSGAAGEPAEVPLAEAYTTMDAITSRSRRLLASSQGQINVLYAGGPLLAVGKISAVVVRVGLNPNSATASYASPSASLAVSY